MSLSSNMPYNELGNLLASLAQEHHAHDPYAIVQYLGNSVGYTVSPHMLQSYLYGAALPEPESFCAFAKAFSLTVEERRNLAWTYIYGYLPP
jgi:hypothetical protein